MLAARLGITVDEAKVALCAHAEAERTPLRDVATRVIDGSVRITP